MKNIQKNTIPVTKWESNPNYKGGLQSSSFFYFGMETAKPFINLVEMFGVPADPPPIALCIPLMYIELSLSILLIVRLVSF